MIITERVVEFLQILRENEAIAAPQSIKLWI